MQDFDLNLFYSGNSYITARCNRFDVQDYSIIVECWLKKDDLLTLQENTRPGAIKELNRVVYAPKFYDSTWQGKNTLKLRPIANSQSTLHQMRGSEKICYPKSISSFPLPGESTWIAVKIESVISGSSL